MTTVRRLLRASLIGVALGACVGGVIYQTKQTERVREVRGRIEPSLKQELITAGFALGDPAYIRIFKEERELELWLKPRDSTHFKLWKTWPIVAMSGKLGPKLKEGDQQAPEGIYTVNAKSMNPQSDYHLSFNIGYPNEFDKALGRTGSFIMVHGKNMSIGCLAMSNPVIEPIYLVVEDALGHGQPSVPIHLFPFRMTDERMAQAEAEQSPWLAFWKNLREGYTRFEQAQIPPTARAAGDHYDFSPP